MTGPVPPDQQHHLPPDARHRIAELREHIGEPDVLRLDNGFRIHIGSQRVALTMDWRRPPRARHGHWNYHSTLLVDGKPVPLAQDIEQLEAIWNNPDLHNYPRSALARDLPDAEIPALGPTPETVPAAVMAGYRRVHASVTKAGGTAELGHSGERWQILTTVPAPGVEQFQLYIALHLDPRGQIDADHVEQILAIDGQDCTALMDEFDLAALGLEMPFGPAAPTPQTPHRAAASARQNSVEVRRATVIRT